MIRSLVGRCVGTNECMIHLSASPAEYVAVSIGYRRRSTSARSASCKLRGPGSETRPRVRHSGGCPQQTKGVVASGLGFGLSGSGWDWALYSRESSCVLAVHCLKSGHASSQGLRCMFWGNKGVEVHVAIGAGHGGVRDLTCLAWTTACGGSLFFGTLENLTSLCNPRQPLNAQASSSPNSLHTSTSTGGTQRLQSGHVGGPATMFLGEGL